ncbi:MAG: hypothetical protein P8M22_06075 [Phycisphaerales bacterium]|nr:hypothetical protein [Phycisphaerales bacterium]
MTTNPGCPGGDLNMNDEMTVGQPVSPPSGRRRWGVFLALATATLQVAAALGLMMIMGTPKGVVADDLALADSSSGEILVEIPLLDNRLQNKQTGITRVYDVQVVLKASTSRASWIREQITRHGHEYRASIFHLWRSADPAHLDEPFLQTLTRRIQDQMLEFLGREASTGQPVVREVILISGTGFPAE